MTHTYKWRAPAKDDPHYPFYSHLMCGGTVHRNDPLNSVECYITLADLPDGAASIRMYGYEDLTIVPMQVDTPVLPFTIASRHVFKANGWGYIIVYPSQVKIGPFLAVPIRDCKCPHCRGVTTGWTVLDVRCATGAVGIEWARADAENDACETANTLNATWMDGYNTAANERAHANG